MCAACSVCVATVSGIHLHSCVETNIMLKQTARDTDCLETVLYPFIGDMGGQNGEKLGSPAWNYGPKQCIMMWFIFHLLNFIQSVQLHASAFPEREKQCSTDLRFDLHFIIG